MKKLILLLGIVITGTCYSQSIYLDQEIAIPIGLGPNGQTLDSLQIIGGDADLKYTLATKYNEQGEINELFSKWVYMDGNYVKNTSLDIKLDKISNTKRTAVLTSINEGEINSKDSTVMLYNKAGLQTASYIYSKDSGTYQLKDSIIWYYPISTVFYSVNGNNDTVDYVAVVDETEKLQMASIDQGDEFHRYSYFYDEDGMLRSISQRIKKDDEWSSGIFMRAYHGLAKPVSAKNHQKHLSIFPNPTTSTIQVTSELGCKVRIYDISGNHIRNLNSRCNEIINLSGLNKGYYIIKISDSLGARETRKVLLR